MVGREVLAEGGMSESENADFQERVGMWRAFARLMIATAAGVAVIVAGLAIAFV